MPFICGDVPIDIQMHKRVFKFIYGLIESGNDYNNICLKLAINGISSQICVIPLTMYVINMSLSNKNYSI